MDAAEYFERGFSHYQANCFDEAYQAFTRAIELSPGFAPAYTGRGYVHHLDSDYEKAIADFTKKAFVKINQKAFDLGFAAADNASKPEG